MIDDLRAARHYLRSINRNETLVEENWLDRAKCATNPQWMQQRDDAEKVFRTFDQLGLLVRQGRVPLDAIAPYCVIPILRAWYDLWPYMRAVRRLYRLDWMRTDFPRLIPSIRCVASSVMHWRNAWRRRGADALKVGASPGRPLKLKPAQRRRLLRLLLKGPLAHGYNTNVWTTARIAELIRREFGVSYHRDHVGRLMRSLNWSHQKPEKRAIERNEEEIERWKQKERPRIRKRCAAGRPHRLCR